MKAPIIVDENGDISVFATLEHLVQALEPIDVRNQEYVVYDSDGKRLSLRIIGVQNHLSVEPVEPVDDQSSRLRQVLIKFMTKTGADAGQLNPMTVHQLITEFLRTHGLTR